MRKPPAGRLLTRLLLGTLVPTVLALGTFALLAHEVARRVLDDELGRRLALAAAGAAGMVLPEQVAGLAEGDTASLTYSNVRRKLDVARERFDVRRISIVSRELALRADTDALAEPGGQAYALGADRLELARAAAGHPSSSPSFLGHDGLPHKRGYASIGEGSEVVGYAVVEASADYFGPLVGFRRQLVLGGLIALAIVMGVTVAMARRVSGPIVRLAAVAERIGRGDLDHIVPIDTRDEVGFLAQTLDDMRAALKARDERLQMMLAGIAHEVRNPLGGLELYAGLLRDALDGQPDRLEEVARIEREVQYLKVVTTEFLDYARRPALDIAPLRAPALLSEVAELAAAVDSQVQIVTDAADNVVACGDPGQVRRALLNLTRNAVGAAARKHAQGGGRVRLSARLRDGRMDLPGAASTDPAVLSSSALAERSGQVEFTVEDNGNGIDPALREKIFMPFFTTREKGTGLGLAFVREIVRAHGGDVSVAVGSLGGASFSFSLPVHEAGIQHKRLA